VLVLGGSVPSLCSAGGLVGGRWVRRSFARPGVGVFGFSSVVWVLGRGEARLGVVVGGFPVSPPAGQAGSWFGGSGGLVVVAVPGVPGGLSVSSARVRCVAGRGSLVVPRFGSLRWRRLFRAVRSVLPGLSLSGSG
jgi:hypothetical protein